jgi:hypothetical protein
MSARTGNRFTCWLTVWSFVWLALDGRQSKPRELFGSSDVGMSGMVRHVDEPCANEDDNYSRGGSRPPSARLFESFSPLTRGLLKRTDLAIAR